MRNRGFQNTFSQSIFINCGGQNHFTMEKLDRHDLSQVMKMIVNNITNQSCELPFRAQLKEHNTTLLLLLIKMNNLILFMMKLQSDSNKGHSKNNDWWSAKYPRPKTEELSRINTPET